MIDQGPPLAALLRWLGEAPPAMRLDDAALAAQVAVAAVVADVYEAVARPEGAPASDRADASAAAGPPLMPTAGLLQAVAPAPTDEAARQRRAWALRLCWMLWNPGIRAHGVPVASLDALLVRELPELAAIVPIAALDEDRDRREELVRRALRAAGLRPAGESASEAADRLRQVDSVEAHRIAALAEQRERRAREVREAMARKAAEEAAAKVSRE